MTRQTVRTIAAAAIVAAAATGTASAQGWTWRAGGGAKAPAAGHAGAPAAHDASPASDRPSPRRGAAPTGAHAPSQEPRKQAPGRELLRWTSEPSLVWEPDSVTSRPSGVLAWPADDAPDAPVVAPVPGHAPRDPAHDSAAPAAHGGSAAGGATPHALPAAQRVAVSAPAPQSAPEWLSIGAQYRGRVEALQGAPAVDARDDAYYLNRVRVQAAVAFTPALRAFVQAQDAQTLGFGGNTTPLSHENTLDLRQGYFEWRQPGSRAFALRAGRQEVAFGAQRLIGAGDWNNTARAFDAARATYRRPGAAIDFVTGWVVDVDQGRLDRRRSGERLHGVYGSLTGLAPGVSVEPFLWVKAMDRVTSEVGTSGAGALYTFGGRTAGTLPRSFDMDVEVAVQRGDLAGDPVAAWAGHYNAGWTAAAWRGRPRLAFEVNHASGDAAGGDGRRGTFDQLFSTNHGKYGIVDVMGWKNMRDVMAGVEVSPLRTLKLGVDVHGLWLATTADGLYVDSGARRVIRPDAASGRVGSEIDVQSTLTLSRAVALSAGFGYLVAGPYLEAATGGGNVWAPYLMWNVVF